MAVEVPEALGLDEWDAWEEKTRAEHPAWWFFHRTLQRKWDRFWARVRDAKWWVLHRVAPRHRYNLLRTGLPPGYYDLDERILHAVFNGLVGFVEVENPSVNYDSKLSTPREIGLERLDWEISLKCDESCNFKPGDEHYGEPTSQSLSAAEQKALYLWWKDVRPNRANPYDDCVPERDYKKIHDIEAAYDAEDEAMLVRLMKIRQSLWT